MSAVRIRYRPLPKNRTRFGVVAQFWLEHRPVTPEVASSSLVYPAIKVLSKERTFSFTLQHVQGEVNRECDKSEYDGNKEPEAEKTDFQVVKPHFPAAFLRLADFFAAFRADIADPIAHAYGEVALQGGHAHLVVEFLIAS